MAKQKPSLDPELAAMEAIRAALEGFTYEQIERILNWACERWPTREAAASVPTSWPSSLWGSPEPPPIRSMPPLDLTPTITCATPED